MDLRTYIFMKRCTAAKIARELGVTDNHFRQIVRGEIKPSTRLAKDIAAYTGYAVTIDDLLSTWAEKQKTCCAY